LRDARLRRKTEVFRDAVRQQATAIVAVHNHPSGDPTPSAADVALTVEIVAAGQLSTTSSSGKDAGSRSSASG
jgi:DNA repair protein RadC